MGFRSASATDLGVVRSHEYGVGERSRRSASVLLTSRFLLVGEHNGLIFVFFLSYVLTIERMFGSIYRIVEEKIICFVRDNIVECLK